MFSLIFFKLKVFFPKKKIKGNKYKLWRKNGPPTKPDKLGAGLRGRLTNSETKVTT